MSQGTEEKRNGKSRSECIMVYLWRYYRELDIRMYRRMEIKEVI